MNPFKTNIVLLLSVFYILSVVSYADLYENCPRSSAGTNFQTPLDLSSSYGYLNVKLNYRNRTDVNSNHLLCYMMDSGIQSPTLRVQPGDTIIFELVNELDEDYKASSGTMTMDSPRETCTVQANITQSTTNVHFHGLHSPPDCHGDNIVNTFINAGESFTYDIIIPQNQPPGIYWYHPHVHGLSELAVIGGATGMFIVDGIQDLQPEVVGLPEQILIFRDTPVVSTVAGNVPAWDLTLNYVPIPYPDYPSVPIRIKPQQKQFWRILNSCADSILNFTLEYDGVIQPLQIVSLDGVPTGVHETTLSHLRDYILIGTAGRVEMIITAPATTVKEAILYTNYVKTGPDGDSDPRRPLVSLIPDSTASDPAVIVPASNPVSTVTRVPTDLLTQTPVTTRYLYFSEEPIDPTDPDSDTNFYITVDGAIPTLFDSRNLPAITAYQGTVEDWVIVNKAGENHDFHIHQLHFLLLERDGHPVLNQKEQYYDTVDIPYWTLNTEDPYHSVKVRMDFTQDIAGYFVYHCHILEHEDKGMMALIQILPFPDLTVHDFGNAKFEENNSSTLFYILIGLGCVCLYTLIYFAPPISCFYQNGKFIIPINCFSDNTQMLPIVNQDHQLIVNQKKMQIN